MLLIDPTGFDVIGLTLTKVNPTGLVPTWTTRTPGNEDEAIMPKAHDYLDVITLQDIAEGINCNRGMNGSNKRSVVPQYVYATPSKSIESSYDSVLRLPE